MTTKNQAYDNVESKLVTASERRMVTAHGIINNIVSSSNRKVKYVFQNPSTYDWYGGETLELIAGEKKTIDYTIDVKGDAMPTCNSVNFILNMGILDFYGANGLEDTYKPDSSAVINVSNFSLVEINE